MIQIWVAVFFFLAISTSLFAEKTIAIDPNTIQTYTAQFDGTPLLNLEISENPDRSLVAYFHLTDGRVFQHTLGGDFKPALVSQNVLHMSLKNASLWLLFDGGKVKSLGTHPINPGPITDYEIRLPGPAKRFPVTFNHIGAVQRLNEQAGDRRTLAFLSHEAIDGKVYSIYDMRNHIIVASFPTFSGDYAKPPQILSSLNPSWIVSDPYIYLLEASHELPARHQIGLRRLDYRRLTEDFALSSGTTDQPDALSSLAVVDPRSWQSGEAFNKLSPAFVGGLTSTFAVRAKTESLLDLSPVYGKGPVTALAITNNWLFSQSPQGILFQHLDDNAQSDRADPDIYEMHAITHTKAVRVAGEKFILLTEVPSISQPGFSYQIQVINTATLNPNCASEVAQQAEK